METETLSNGYILGAILMASLGTALTRFLPYFLLQKSANNTLLKYLQETMPLLIMTLLVFFSLKDVDFKTDYGFYEMLGISCVLLCFLLSKNQILSMFVGIVCYMLAINVFR